MSVASQDFQSLGELIERFSCDVSLIDQPRSRSQTRRVFHYSLLSPEAYRRFLDLPHEKVDMEPLERALARHAKKCLTRGKRQELTRLLNELLLSASQSEDPGQLMELVGQARRLSHEQDQALDMLADALIKSGVLGEDRLQAAEQRYAQDYIRRTAAQLQSKIDQEVTTQRAALARITEEYSSLKLRLGAEAREHRSNLEQELFRLRETTLAGMANEKRALEARKAELERQQHIIEANLGTVTQQLRDAGDKVVGNFLLIAPLLRATGLFPTTPSGGPGDARTSTPVPTAQARALPEPA